MPATDRLRDMLAPDQSRVRVGWLPPGQARGECRISLRPLRHTDPPLVLAHPLLLAGPSLSG